MFNPSILQSTNATDVGFISTTDSDWHTIQNWEVQNLPGYGNSGVFYGNLIGLARCLDLNCASFWDLPRSFIFSRDGEDNGLLSLAGDQTPSVGNSQDPNLNGCDVGYVLDGWDFSLRVKGLDGVTIDWVVAFDIKLAFRDNPEASMMAIQTGRSLSALGMRLKR